jgi:hypothetical protein
MVAAWDERGAVLRLRVRLLLRAVEQQAGDGAGALESQPPGRSEGGVDERGIRNPLLGSKQRMSETLHLRLRALCFYPTVWRRTADSSVNTTGQSSFSV